MNQDTLQTVITLAQSLPGLRASHYIKLYRFAKTHRNICTSECNGHGMGSRGETCEEAEAQQAKYNARKEAIIKAFTAILTELDPQAKAETQGDPRGCTLYIRLPKQGSETFHREIYLA